jgi:hypothetical protein
VRHEPAGRVAARRSRFEKVYDYMPGKADWFASGLPKEGRLASVPNIGDAAQREVPTCAPAEKVENARDRVRAAGCGTPAWS